MIVTLDGRKLEREFGSGRTLQSLVDEVRAQHLRDRLVVEVSLDGELLTNPVLSERLVQSIDGVEQVDLSSGEPRELAMAALREAAEQMEIAGDAHIEVAEQLRAGRGAKAIEQFGVLLGIWGACQSSIRNAGYILERDLGTMEYQGRPIHEWFRELAARLRDVRDAFESRDYVLLADILKYEMPEVCQQWHELLSHASQALETVTSIDN